MGQRRGVKARGTLIHTHVYACFLIVSLNPELPGPLGCGEIARMNSTRRTCAFVQEVRTDIHVGNEFSFGLVFFICLSQGLILCIYAYARTH